MLPGSANDLVMPNSAISTSQLESDLSSILTDTDALQTTIESGLVQTFSDLDRDVSTISSNMVGDIANGLDAVELVRDNASRKVIASATNVLSDAYSKILDLGFNIPTLDDVRYAQASGDYMGSMTGATPIMAERFDPATNYFQNVGPDVDPTPSSFGLLCPPEDQVNVSGVMVCLGPAVVPGPDGTNVIINTGSGSGCDPGPIIGIKPLGSDIQYWPGNSGIRYSEGFSGPHTGEPSGGWCIWFVTSSLQTGGVAETATMVLPAGAMFPVIDVKTGNWMGATSESETHRRVKCAVVSYCYNTDPLVTPPPTPTPTVPPEASCPLPVKPTCVDDFKLGINPSGTTFTEFCKRIKDTLGNVGGESSTFEKLLTIGTLDLPWLVKLNPFLGALLSGSNAILPQLTKRFGKHIDKIVNEVLQARHCDNAVFLPLALMNSLLGLVDKYTGTLPPQIVQEIKHAMNYACQFAIPSPSEADAMLLADQITEETWVCLQKAAGNYVDEFKRLFESKRTRTDPQSLAQLFRRKQITRDELDEKMRGNGVIRDTDFKDIYNMTQAWPSMSDVTRFLVRDVADKKIVDRFGMDDEFPEKWQGKLIEYADAIGVNEDLGKYYWRAHWHIPSFTMLSDMLHRLRPGEVDESIEVTREDVFDALKQDDWLPFWANRMIETSYKPVTKTDAVRAYMVHAIDEVGLKGHYMDVGYNDKSADFYVGYQKKLRQIAEAKTSGMPTIRMLTRQYARCEISEDQYRKAMEKLVLSPEHEAQALEAARAAKKVEETKLSMRQVQIPFKLGLLDFDEATNMLSQTELDPACVRSMVDSWSLQQLKRPKHLAAGQLCKMRERGIITQAQQIVALVRNNWSKEDATRIAQECDATVTEKQFKRSQMNAERAQRLRDKDAKERAKRLKLEACGPPSCPTNTPGGKLVPPNIVPDSLNQ